MHSRPLSARPTNAKERSMRHPEPVHRNSTSPIARARPMGEDEDKSSTESEKCEGMAVEIVNLTVCEIKKRREEQEISEDELLQRNELLREKYAAILTFSEVEPLSDRMMKLRRLVISEGLPPESDEERACMSTGLRTTLRGTVWKLLLGALHMDSEHYVKLVADGPSWADKKIRDDTFRTFQGAAEFRSRVSEVSMARVLNCFVRQNFTADDQTTAGEDGSANNTQNGYVQGMNVLLAPFLFVMPEVDAFFCFNALITRHCPRYVLANLDGTHHGCSLVDRVLNILDPELFAYLHRKSLSATVYAFPMIMTLMASLQPLSEVLRVWDATFAFGVHLDVLLCVCVCMLMRDKLLRDHNPFQYLMPRALSNVTLDAEIIVTCALKLLRLVPTALFEELVRHPVEKPANASNILSIKPGDGELRPGSADYTRGRRRHSISREDSEKNLLAHIANMAPNTRLVTGTHERAHRRRKSKTANSRRASRREKSATSPGPMDLKASADCVPGEKSRSRADASARLYNVHTTASRGQMRDKHQKNT